MDAAVYESWPRNHHGNGSSSSIEGQEEGEGDSMASSSSFSTDSFLAFLLVSVPLAAFAVVANAMVFLVFVKKPVFRKILSNRLVINLMLLNLVSCLLLFPAVVLDMALALTSSSSSTSSSPLGLCIWGSMFSSLVTHGSVLAMLAVGVDQYLAILYPLEYSTKVTNRVSWQLISLVWSLGLLASGLGSLQLASRNSPWSSCRGIDDEWWLRKQELHRGWLSSVSLVFYILPMVVLSYIYLRIFWAARKSSIDMRRNNPVANSGGHVGHGGCGNSGPNLDYSVDESHHLGLEDQQQQHNSDRKSSFPLLRPNAVVENLERQRQQPSQDPEEEAVMASEEEEEKEAIINSHRQANASHEPPSEEEEEERPTVVESEERNKRKEGEKEEGEEKKSPQKEKSSPFKRPMSPTAAMKAIMAQRPIRAPKLALLRSRGGRFSASMHAEPYHHSPASPILSGKARRSMRGPTPPTEGMETPKRKCSFSSSIECRLVEEDGAKHHTFLFSIEAPSPPPTPRIESREDGGSLSSIVEAANGIGDREGEDDERSRGIEPLNASVTTSSDGRTQPLASSQKQLSAEDTSTAAAVSAVSVTSLRSIVNNQSNCSLMRLAGNGGGEGEHRIGRMEKAGSILSLTSQAARRLSCTVSRRASSVYHFFHYKEELRTAKISTLVVVLGFACWSPFFVVMVFLATGTVEAMTTTTSFISAAVFWLHYAYCLLSLVFAALTPYLYVFRSEKVQNCLAQILSDTRRSALVCCCSKSGSGPKGLSGGGGHRESVISRTRSFSCPSLPNAHNGHRSRSSLANNAVPRRPGDKSLTVERCLEGPPSSRREDDTNAAAADVTRNKKNNFVSEEEEEEKRNVEQEENRRNSNEKATETAGGGNCVSALKNAFLLPRGGGGVVKQLGRKSEKNLPLSPAMVSIGAGTTATVANSVEGRKVGLRGTLQAVA